MARRLAAVSVPLEFLKASTTDGGESESLLRPRGLLGNVSAGAPPVVSECGDQLWAIVSHGKGATVWNPLLLRPLFKIEDLDEAVRCTAMSSKFEEIFLATKSGIHIFSRALKIKFIPFKDVRGCIVSGGGMGDYLAVVLDCDVVILKKSTGGWKEQGRIRCDITTLGGGMAAVTSPLVSPESNLPTDCLVVGGKSGDVAIYNMDNLQEFSVSRPTVKGEITAVCVHFGEADETMSVLAIGTAQGSSYLFDLDSAELVYSFDCEHGVSALGFVTVPSLRDVGLLTNIAKKHDIEDLDELRYFLVAGTAAGDLLFFDLRSGEPQAKYSLEQHHTPVALVAHPDPELYLENRELAEARSTKMFHYLPSGVIFVEQLSQTTQLMTLGTDNSILTVVLDRMDGGPRVLRERRGHCGPVNSIEIYNGDEYGELELLTSCMPGPHRERPVSQVGCISLSKALGVNHFSRKLMPKFVYGLPPILGSAACPLRHDDWANYVTIHKELRSALLWKISDRKVVDRPVSLDKLKNSPPSGGKRSPYPTAVAVSFDGSFVFLGYDDGQIHLFHLQSSAHRCALPSLSKPVRALATTSDGLLIAASSDDLCAFKMESMSLNSPPKMLSKIQMSNLIQSASSEAGFSMPEAPVLRTMKLYESMAAIAINSKDQGSFVIVVDIALGGGKHEVSRVLKVEHGGAIQSLQWDDLGKRISIIMEGERSQLAVFDVITSRLLDWVEHENTIFYDHVWHPTGLGIYISRGPKVSPEILAERLVTHKAPEGLDVLHMVEVVLGYPLGCVQFLGDRTICNAEVAIKTPVKPRSLDYVADDTERLTTVVNSPSHLKVADCGDLTTSSKHSDRELGRMVHHQHLRDLGQNAMMASHKSHEIQDAVSFFLGTLGIGDGMEQFTDHERKKEVVDEDDDDEVEKVLGGIIKLVMTRAKKEPALFDPAAHRKGDVRMKGASKIQSEVKKAIEFFVGAKPREIHGFMSSIQQLGGEREEDLARLTAALVAIGFMVDSMANADLAQAVLSVYLDYNLADIICLVFHVEDENDTRDVREMPEGLEDLLSTQLTALHAAVNAIWKPIDNEFLMLECQLQLLSRLN